MKPVNVALVGCGAVAEHYYAPALKKLSASGTVSVKAVCDSSKVRAEKLSLQFPGSAVDEIAQFKDIDLAIIATPVAFHAEQTIEALTRGSSVLCEKPMAQTSIQCQAMLEAAGNKLLAVGHFRRQFPAALAIKEILTRELLGKAISFNFSEGSPFQWPAATGSLFNKKEAGGGVLMDLGVHLLDLALWFFGDVESSQEYEDDAMGGVEANCRLQLKFRNGVSGKVRLSRDWFLDNKYAIDCEKGSVTWGITQATKIEVVSSDASAMKAIDELRNRVCLPSIDQPDHLRAFFNQLHAVVESVAENRVCETVVTGAEAMKAMRLIEACYEKAQLMPMPWLNEIELKRAQLLKGVG
ncbi:MAG: Gfo/Idh/MocA family oxidoreductase [Candidatus Obscuribacterales bacterium]|nr:Gfo/Idh/MocA family oxidoreductase [Candidatus Obscuribacterales bacterium]